MPVTCYLAENPFASFILIREGPLGSRKRPETAFQIPLAPVYPVVVLIEKAQHGKQPAALLDKQTTLVLIIVWQYDRFEGKLSFHRNLPFRFLTR